MNHKKIFMFSRTVLGPCPSQELLEHKSVDSLLKQLIISNVFQCSPSLPISVHFLFH